MPCSDAGDAPLAALCLAYLVETLLRSSHPHARPNVSSPAAVVLLSLRAQLRAPPTSTRPVTSLSFNPDGSSNASRCMALAWLPGTEGTALVAAHRNGAVLLYHKVSGWDAGSGWGVPMCLNAVRIG